jgi:branched-chain amino acid transport system substrate-binding protein
MIRKLILIVAVGATLTGGALAQTIKIGLSGPFTGGSASMGVSMRDGVKLAVSEINKAGGIMGKPG